MKDLNELMVQMSTLDKQDFRDQMIDLTVKMAQLPDAAVRETYAENASIDTYNGNNLEHFFGEGTYIRKITMNKGSVIMSAIHTVLHPFFVLKGKATVLSEDGLINVEAPYFGMTKPGTQRLLLIHEDMEWYTVHPTEKTNVEEILQDVTSKDYDHPKLKIN
tara:strand:+ start:5146 stop:5631 length:486 start_codon:yes stop_codon:yes gene_type:complete